MDTSPYRADTHAIVRRLEAGRGWPSGVRIPGLLLAHLAPWLAGWDIVLDSANEILVDSNRELANLRGLARHDAPNKWGFFRLVFGENTNELVNLPWLDVDRVIPIGSTADYGGDGWIVADYRTNPPRVVANEFHEKRTSNGGSQFVAEWKVIAQSIESFAGGLSTFDRSKARRYTGPEMR
jgi:hypothetical protein